MNSPCPDGSASARSVRGNCPGGIFGWLSYIFDHRLRGYRRPVDWNSLWVWEQSNQGEPVFANGGVLVLLGLEIDAFRLIARGLGDTEVADTLRLTNHEVGKLRREISYRLGAFFF